MAAKLVISPTGSGFAVHLNDDKVSIIRNIGVMETPAAPDKTHFIDVAVGYDDTIYALGANGWIYSYYDPTNSWIREAGKASNARAIAAVPDEPHALIAAVSDDKIWQIDFSQASPNWSVNSRYSTQTEVPPTVGNAPMGQWEYSVKEGDWLYKIVREQYGTAADPRKTARLVQSIIWLNPQIQANANLIQPGQVLKMPSR